MQEQTREPVPEPEKLAELREAARLDPGNAQLRYWFGVQLAQFGQYPQASAEIGTALALQADLHVARFQLGLLHLTMTEAERAAHVWAPLEQLEDGHALKHFKHGLEALIRDDFAACIDHLERGIAANTFNEPLSRDMELVRDKAREAAGSRDIVRTDFSLYSGKSN